MLLFINYAMKPIYGPQWEIKFTPCMDMIPLEKLLNKVKMEMC